MNSSKSSAVLGNPLPVFNVARIMRDAISDDAKIVEGAKETRRNCVAESKLFITSEGKDQMPAKKHRDWYS